MFNVLDEIENKLIALHNRQSLTEFNELFVFKMFIHHIGMKMMENTSNLLRTEQSIQMKTENN